MKRVSEICPTGLRRAMETPRIKKVDLGNVNTPSVIARSPCDEAIQGPRAAAPGLRCARNDDGVDLHITRPWMSSNAASDPRVPLVAAILPKAAVAPADVAERLDGFDPHHVFRHLVAELAFDPQTQRGAMGDRKRFVVHLIGEDRLRMKSVDEIDRLVIFACPVERLLERVGAVK